MSRIGPDGQPWHSRRHRTREAQDAARETYLTNRGPAARRRRAQERQASKEQS